MEFKDCGDCILKVPRVEAEAANQTESHMTSAAAFVEGGIQDACDDSCSICLEAFCESEPSTVTSCKHEFHLQCILEWCQRSSQCPMCWQSIHLKDPTSQELLEAVEQERSFRLTPARNPTIFHHPTLGDFELQHLPTGASDSELEERIMQHLAAAAAMERAHHIARREGQRSRSSAHGRPHFLVFSTHPNGSPAGHVSPNLAQIGGEETEPAANTLGDPPVPIISGSNGASRQTSQFSSVHPNQVSASASGSRAMSTHSQENSNSISDADQSSPPNQDRAGPSDFQSFSDSLKSRLNAVSMRYKESISKSTRGWKDKLFSRNASMTDLGTEVRREMDAGIASVSRIMKRLETRETQTASCATVLNHPDDHSISEQSSLNDVETSGRSPFNDRDAPPTSRAASSGSS